MKDVQSIIQYQPDTSIIQKLATWLLGGFLLYTGTGHLTFSREEFQAQVPLWVPLEVDLVVVLSGIVEIILGLSLIGIPRYKAIVGWVVALFFVAIFPGNISQYVNGRDAFGLNTDTARAIRLLFQPVLIGWVLWSTGAWEAWKNRNSISQPDAESE